MKDSQEIIGQAVRVECGEIDGKVYLVFEITNEQYRQYIKKHWTDDVEFRVIDKKLVSNE